MCGDHKMTRWSSMLACEDFLYWYQGRRGTIVELRLLDTSGVPEVILHAQEQAHRYGVDVHVQPYG